MKPKKLTFTHEPLEPLIFHIRGHRVILDADLARLYGVPTHRFNEAFKRNRYRFPADFAFQLTAAEWVELRSQFAILVAQPIENKAVISNSSQIAMSSGQPSIAQTEALNRSQFVTSSARHRGGTYRPWAFAEHGALMAANILRSERAVQMSVFVIRAFVRLREQIATNQAVLKRLAEIDKTLLQHDAGLRDIYRKLLPLLQPPPEPPKRRIGFNPEDKA